MLLLVFDVIYKIKYLEYFLNYVDLTCTVYYSQLNSLIWIKSIHRLILVSLNNLITQATNNVIAKTCILKRYSSKGWMIFALP